MKEISGYALSRMFFDWSFENPSENNPTLTALYFFIVEVSNRLGWKSEFGITPKECMEAIGISSYNTYKKNFDKLCDLGFIQIIKKSTNQYQNNVIALSNNDKALNKALNKALSKQMKKQDESTCDILKHKNNKPKTDNNIENENKNNNDYSFEKVWELYDKKVGEKSKIQKKWEKLPNYEKQKIIAYIPDYIKSNPDKKYRKNFETFLNNKSWNDEIIENRQHQSYNYKGNNRQSGGKLIPVGGSSESSKDFTTT